MHFDISELLGFAIIFVLLAGYTRWMTNGPSARTRELVAQEFEAKGLTFLSVRPMLKFRMGRGSRIPLMARGEDGDGNIRKLYFEIDFWADALTQSPRVRPIPKPR